METAAQGLDQLDGKIDLLALQAGQLAFGDQQLLLHAEGVEVAADAFAVATHGQVEVGPGDIAGLALVDHLLLQGAQLAEVIADLAEGLDQRLVVLADGQVVVGVAFGQVGAAAATVEDRQGDRRRHLEEAARRLQHVAGVQGGEAGHRAEIEVGIELGLCRVDVAARRLDPPARGNDVGAAAEQLRREHRGQAQAGRVQRLRALQFETAIGPLAQQHGEGDAGAGDVLLGGAELLAGGGQLGLRLLQLDLAVESGAHALLAQLGHALRAFQFFLGEIAHGKGVGEVAVGAGDARREADARGLAVDPGGIGLAEGGFPGGALAAPEVEVVVEAERQVLDRRIAAAERCRGHAGRRADAGVAGLGVQRRLARGILRLGRCRRLARTRLGDLQVGGALQGFADQLVELPVAEPGPPVLARPGRWRKGYAVQAPARLEGACRLQSGVRFQAFGSDAAGGQHYRRGQRQSLRPGMEKRERHGSGLLQAGPRAAGV